MKTLLLIITALALAGCQRPTARSDAAESELPEFSARHGVKLPEQTRRSIGLQLVDVDEKSIETSVPLQLRVYRVTSDAVLATGILNAQQAEKVQPNAELQATTAAGLAVTGHMVSVEKSLAETTGTAEALVAFPALADVRVGDFLEASIRLAGEDGSTSIPAEALLDCSEGTFVYTVSGEHLVRTEVEVGRRGKADVEVLDGLYAGDQVVLRPVMALWMTELAAVKGGQSCCPLPPKEQ
jgi:hypothetical protein